MFDVFNIFFLILAIVIFLMLRNALGRRTGNERPPFDPYSRRQAGDDKVVSLPGARGRVGDAPPPTPPTNWDRFAAPGSATAEGLAAIAATDPAFDPGQFLEGARVAYEMIIGAFANGDRRALRDLLSKSVHDGFIEAIDAREKNGETMESTFVGIDSADIVDATLKARTAQITVKFRSQLISVTRDRDGETVDGDPKAVRDVTDIWTFERDTSSRDPNWKLAATEAAH